MLGEPVPVVAGLLRVPGQAEQPAQGVRLVFIAERAAPPQLRHQPLSDAGQVVREGRRAQPEAVEPGGPPVQEQVGQVAGGAGEDERVRTEGSPVQLVEPVLAGIRRRRVILEEDVPSVGRSGPVAGMPRDS